MLPKVSVIIPIHNAEPYLNQCLDSVLAQTLDDIEVICVENGSNDDSLGILREYEEKDSRLHVIVQEKGLGAWHARNEGMAHATGKYLSFLDADDYFDLTMLEQLFKKAEACEADIVLCDAYTFDEIDGKIGEDKWIVLDKNFLPNKTIFSYKDMPDHIFQLNACVVWNKFFCRRFVERHRLRFQEIPTYNDLLFAFTALIKAKKMAVLNKRLVYYRINNKNSITSTQTSWPEGVFVSTIALKERLVADAVYESVKKSFVNFSLVHFIDFSRRFKNFEDFRWLCRRFREQYCRDLDILGHERTYFDSTDLYMWLEEILSQDSEEWIFRKYITFDSRSDFLKRIPQGARIVLYGAGDVGRFYYARFLDTQYYQVILWVDGQWEAIGSPVSAPQKITETAYDFVLIVVSSLDTADEIKKNLMKLDAPEEKIVWCFENKKGEEHAQNFCSHSML